MVILFIVSWIVSFVVALWFVGRLFYDVIYETYIFRIAPLLKQTPNLRERYGEWAIVTGASDGIGLGYCKCLAVKGLNIVLIGRNLEKLKVAEGTVRATNPSVSTRVIVHDFSKTVPGDSEKLKRELQEILRSVGILVNNVGVYDPYEGEFGVRFQSLSPDPYTNAAEVVKVNIDSALLMTSIVLPSLVERKRGIIVNISSIIAVQPIGGDSIYASTKAFLDFFTRSLRVDLHNTGVEIQGVYPGIVKTKLVPAALGKDALLYAGAVDCDPFCKQAVNSIGMIAETYGCIQHRLQGTFLLSLSRFLPLGLRDALYVRLSERRRQLCTILKEKKQ